MICCAVPVYLLVSWAPPQADLMVRRFFSSIQSHTVLHAAVEVMWPGSFPAARNDARVDWLSVSTICMLITLSGISPMFSFNPLAREAVSAMCGVARPQHKCICHTRSLTLTLHSFRKKPNNAVSSSALRYPSEFGPCEVHFCLSIAAHLPRSPA